MWPALRAVCLQLRTWPEARYAKSVEASCQLDGAPTDVRDVLLPRRKRVYKTARTSTVQRPKRSVTSEFRFETQTLKTVSCCQCAKSDSAKAPVQGGRYKCSYIHYIEESTCQDLKLVHGSKSLQNGGKHI